MEKDLIYHYTHLDSFFKIVNSASLWATSAEYLNDYSEGKYAERYLDVFDRELPEMNVLLRKAIKSMRFFIRVFIVSFCENGDLLGQWKHYGKSSCGISIGFNRLGLLEMQKRLKYQISHVEYGQVSHTDRIEKAKQKIIALFASVDSKGVKSMDDAIALIREDPRLTIALFSEIFSLKEKAFADEKEWRIICTSVDHPVSHRYHNNTILPYVSIGYGNILDLVDEVKLNPDVSDRTLSSIRDYLFDKRYYGGMGKKDILVSKSDIPFIG